MGQDTLLYEKTLFVILSSDSDPNILPLFAHNISSYFCVHELPIENKICAHYLGQ